MFAKKSIVNARLDGDYLPPHNYYCPNMFDDEFMRESRFYREIVHMYACVVFNRRAPAVLHHFLKLLELRRRNVNLKLGSGFIRSEGNGTRQVKSLL